VARWLTRPHGRNRGVWEAAVRSVREEDRREAWERGWGRRAADSSKSGPASGARGGTRGAASRSSIGARGGKCTRPSAARAEIDRCDPVGHVLRWEGSQERARTPSQCSLHPLHGAPPAGCIYCARRFAPAPSPQRRPPKGRRQAAAARQPRLGGGVALRIAGRRVNLRTTSFRVSRMDGRSRDSSGILLCHTRVPALERGAAARQGRCERGGDRRDAMRYMVAPRRTARLRQLNSLHRLTSQRPSAKRRLTAAAAG